MLPTRLVAFSVLCYLAEAVDSSRTNVTFTTSFTGLQDDFNLGHMGYVYLQSDEKISQLEISSCQYYNVNQSTCNFPEKTPKSDNHAMVLRAWTALTLRDNMLVLFGYLMHQSSSELLTQDITSSLRLLYDEVRLNNVKTMDILPRIKSMAKTSVVSQVLSLLKLLNNVVPPFCRSAVDELGKQFSKRKELLKNVLGAQRGIDLFTDIGLQMVPMLRIKSTKRNYDRAIEASMGKEFAIFFAAIREGRIALTQPVLAIFMLNMRFAEMSAKENEDFRFICDVLRFNKVPNWSPGFSGTCCVNFKDPYDMVQTMMRTLVERPMVDDLVKSTVVKVLPRLVRVAKSDVSSERMDRFFGYSRFNVSLFLESLADEARITEVTGFRNMVVNGTIDLSYALKGFIRYFYDSPRKLAIAFMERTRYRVPMSNEAKNVVDIILVYLRDGRRFSILESTSNAKLRT